MQMWIVGWESLRYHDKVELLHMLSLHGCAQDGRLGWIRTQRWIKPVYSTVGYLSSKLTAADAWSVYSISC
jgi:hypothetical protein